MIEAVDEFAFWMTVAVIGWAFVVFVLWSMSGESEMGDAKASGSQMEMSDRVMRLDAENNDLAGKLERVENREADVYKYAAAEHDRAEHFMGELIGVRAELHDALADAAKMKTELADYKFVADEVRIALTFLPDKEPEVATAEDYEVLAP